MKHSQGCLRSASERGSDAVDWPQVLHTQSSHDIYANDLAFTEPKNPDQMHLKHFTDRSVSPSSLITHLYKQTFEVNKTTQVHKDNVLAYEIDLSKTEITDFQNIF